MPAKITLVSDFEGAQPTLTPANRDLVDFFAALRHRLVNETLPHVVIHDDMISVLRLSADGPDASASISESGCWLIAVAGWHEEIPSTAAAIDILARVVEGTVRVRVDKLGSKPWRYALEFANPDGRWLEGSVIAFPRPFWPGKLRHSYLQNSRADRR